jgi:hypothetical protein
MNLDRRTALAALAAAGLLWGTTVPVTKLALQWLPPGWLTVARFGLDDRRRIGGQHGPGGVHAHDPGPQRGGAADPRAPSPQPASRIRRGRRLAGTSAGWSYRLRVVRYWLVTFAASRNRSGSWS